jgi:hypothetical protein
MFPLKEADILEAVALLVWISDPLSGLEILPSQSIHDTAELQKHRSNNRRDQ